MASPLEQLRDALTYESEAIPGVRTYTTVVCRTADLRLALDAIQAAKAWWLSRRPLDYTDAEHRDNPTVNCVGGAEKTLAIMVARLDGPEET